MEDFVKVKLLCAVTCVMLMASLMYASTPAKQIPNGKKAKVVGEIMSRNGDMVNVKEKKTGQMVVVNLTDSTKVEREKGALRMRRSDMDVTAMLPGLTISAEGVGNAKGQLDASKISFDPDAFAIEVAQEQQIQANQAATQQAQATADVALPARRLLKNRLTRRSIPLTRPARLRWEPALLPWRTPMRFRW